MRSFDEYKTDKNNKKIKNGIKIFERQLFDVEGKDILIDGLLSRGIILNHLNDMSTTKNQRGLNVPLDSPIKKGSYVKEICSDETYLVMSRIDSHFTYKTCTMDYCNQTLNWLGLSKPIPCYCDNSSYGTKGVVNSSYILEYDGKILFYVQYNADTAQIRQDMRFIFDNSENSVYKVVDVNRVVTENVLRIVMDKTEFLKGKDNPELNIAYNEFLIKEENQTTSEIKGLDSINRYNTETYSVEGSGWSVEIDYMNTDKRYVDVSEITDNSVEIKNQGYIGYEFKVVFKKGDIILEKLIRLVK